LLVLVLVVVLVAGGGRSPTPNPSGSTTLAAKDPNRTRTPEEIDKLVRAAALTTADVPGATLDDQSEPPGFLMPCGFEIQDFPAGGRANGLDFKDANSNYTDERIWVGPDQARATTYLTKLKNLVAGCANYSDSSGEKVTISANDRNWAIGDGAIYVDETKGGIHLSWGYMRQGTAIILVSTINDTDQKASIGQQLGRVSDRLKAADAS
jgi:hypothetical protein